MDDRRLLRDRRRGAAHALLILAACAPAPPPGTLVYVHGDEHPEVRALSLPDGAPRTLAQDAWPAAPDPRGEAALLVRAGESLALAPLTGGDLVPLTPTAPQVRNPSWSPDGAWLAFESSAASFRDLYRVRRDGSDLRRLTAAPHGSFEPSVDTSGRIVYTSSRDGNPELYLQDGEAVVRLTDEPAEDRRPAWSGDRIAWLAGREGHTRVWTMHRDGSDARPLRAGTTEDQDFAWSPDGSRIAVVTRGATVDLELVDLDGRVQSLATDHVEENPAWSPDSRWLAFSSDRDGDPELYLFDGARVRRLTHDPGPDWLPRWLAD